RGDAGFARPNLYQMLEHRNRMWGGVGYVIGISKNSAFERKLDEALDEARSKFERSGDKEQTFQWFSHQAQSWDRARSIVGKAEVGPQGDNPRFVITSLDEFPARMIYEQGYCPRGDAENIVKSLKSHVQSDRLSLKSFEANFFRLLQHTVAHRLLMGLKQVCGREARRRRTVRRKVDVSEEEDGDNQKVIEQLDRLAGAQLDTIRLLLLKVAATVNQAVRRLHVECPRSFPMAGAYGALASRLDGY
ncbi:MAG: transposase, partial [Bradymonadaceae bacterium]